MIASTMFSALADVSSAASIMRDFISPVMQALCVAASLACAFFLVVGGCHYVTSRGNPENLDHAKRIIRNAVIGLVIVLGAAALTSILTHAYASSNHAVNSRLPNLTPIQPTHVSNGLVDILIKSVTGFLNNIIQTIAEPFLKALSFFTSSTPLMADYSAVFNLWLVVVGMTDALFVLVVALIGFHVMGAASFGFDEVEFKHLLPKLSLIFLLVNCSIFAIDGVIELSNAMIKVINAASPSTSVWDVLTKVVKQASGESVAALLIMVAFLIFAAILLVYYIGRLVVLFIGAVLSPLLLVLWLIPGFRDFSESAARVYMSTVFVLFVHVVILQLAASLLAGMMVGSGDQTPNTLMAMMIGLATLVVLLKTQGLMMHLSYVSLGPRTARKLGGQFITGVSFIAGHRAMVSTVNRKFQNDGVAIDGYQKSAPRFSNGSRQPSYAFATLAPTGRSAVSSYDGAPEASNINYSQPTHRSKISEANIAPRSVNAKTKKGKS